MVLGTKWADEHTVYQTEGQAPTHISVASLRHPTFNCCVSAMGYLAKLASAVSGLILTCLENLTEYSKCQKHALARQSARGESPQDKVRTQRQHPVCPRPRSFCWAQDPLFNGNTTPPSLCEDEKVPGIWDPET